MIFYIYLCLLKKKNECLGVCEKEKEEEKTEKPKREFNRRHNGRINKMITNGCEKMLF